MLPHLDSGWEVDQAILSEDERLVIIRFGVETHPTWMLMDEHLYKLAFDVSNFAVVYLVDTENMTEYNEFYELYDPFTLMFFFRNKLI